MGERGSLLIHKEDWEEFRSQEKPFLSIRTRHWKYLLSKHENLSLDPRILKKVWAWRCPPVINPSPREAEPGGSLGHNNIISYPVSSSSVKYLVSNIKVERDGGRHPASTLDLHKCTHVYAHLHTLMNTYTCIHYTTHLQAWQLNTQKVIGSAT